MTSKYYGKNIRKVCKIPLLRRIDVVTTLTFADIAVLPLLHNSTSYSPIFLELLVFFEIQVSVVAYYPPPMVYLVAHV